MSLPSPSDEHVSAITAQSTQSVHGARWNGGKKALPRESRSRKNIPNPYHTPNPKPPRVFWFHTHPHHRPHHPPNPPTSPAIVLIQLPATRSGGRGRVFLLW